MEKAGCHGLPDVSIVYVVTCCLPSLIFVLLLEVSRVSFAGVCAIRAYPYEDFELLGNF